MAYSVTILPVAMRQILALDGHVQRRIRMRIDGLATDPRPRGVKALSGHPGALRLRVGDYRVLYRIEDKQLVVLVVTVAHRREAYR